jgi:broad specificity phosphatase PhoE
MVEIGDKSLFARLLMVRHGESTCNTVHRIAGQQDAPLTLLGRVQAERVSRKHRDQAIDQVYVSPLSRASETADIIVQDFRKSQPTVVVDDRLIERDFGSYTLQSKSILQRKHGVAEYERAMNSNSPTMHGGETFDEFHSRVRQFFDEELLPTLRLGKVVCVVSHKYVVELICRFILDRQGDQTYDLRLPNSQMLQGDRVESYVKRENKHRNMFYDWLVVNHPIVFCVGMVLGLLGKILGVDPQISPYVLLALLVVATVISMCRIEIESAASYVKDQATVRTVLLRYLALPVLFALLVHLTGASRWEIVAFVAVLMAAPASVVSITVSRCVGGMIMSSFAYVLLSSLTSTVSLAVALVLLLHKSVLIAIVVSAVGSTGIAIGSYLLVRSLRSNAPIRVAKFGERNSYVAVLLLTAFIVLVTLKINLTNWAVHLPVAIGVVLSFRLMGALFARHRNVQAVDDYVSMTYANLFIVVVIAMLSGIGGLGDIATWCLVPTFGLAFFDSWYATRLAPPANDSGWRTALRIDRAMTEGSPAGR